MKNRLLLALFASISCAHAAEIRLDPNDYMDYFTQAPLADNTVGSNCLIARLVTNEQPFLSKTYHAETALGYLDGHQGNVWIEPFTKKPLQQIDLFKANLATNGLTQIATIGPEQRPAILAASPRLACVTGNPAWNQELYNKTLLKYAASNAKRQQRLEISIAYAKTALKSLVSVSENYE